MRTFVPPTAHSVFARNKAVLEGCPSTLCKAALFGITSGASPGSFISVRTGHSIPGSLLKFFGHYRPCAVRQSSHSRAPHRVLPRGSPKQSPLLFWQLLAAQRIRESARPNWATIAYDLGYSSQQHFITDFKQVLGKTPLQYKKELIANWPKVHLSPDVAVTKL